MNQHHIERAIEKIALEAIEKRVFPGCTIGFQDTAGMSLCQYGTYSYENGSKAVSATKTRYDIASLTKAMVAFVTLTLVQEGRLRLDDRVSNLTPLVRTRSGKDSGLEIHHLLNYTAFFREKGMPGSDSFRLEVTGKAGDRFQYSNLPPFVLGDILERQLGIPLSEIMSKRLFEPLSMDNTSFLGKGADKSIIAPTEGKIHGVVHDGFSRSWNRPIGTSGIFSTAEDVLKFVCCILAQTKVSRRKMIGKRLFLRMISNTLPEHLQAEHSYGYGFDKFGWNYFDGEYRSFCRQAIVMTGFTGCLIVAHVESGTGAAILSNAIHPKRQKKGKEDGKSPIYHVRKAMLREMLRG